MCVRFFTLWWLVTAALGLAFELDTSDTWVWLLCLFLPNLSLTLGLRSVWDAERCREMSPWAVFPRCDVRFLAEFATGCVEVVFLGFREAADRALGLFRMRADVLAVAHVSAPLANLNRVGLSWGRLDLLGGWPLAVVSVLSLLMLVTLVWYLDATLPYPDRMRRQPFHFLLQDDFWQLFSEAADRYKRRQQGTLSVHALQAPDGHCCNPAGEPAVTVLDVRKHVGNVHMDHLSIDFICNRITVIFGHSGSGKTTLVKMICGILAPDEGSIYVHDVNVQHKLSEARSLISYCAEKSTLFQFMTVKEHINYSKLLNASSQTPAAWREVDTDDLLYRLRMSDYTDALISALATGVQRKVAVAVALSRPAEVLVLDEPTSGMDAVSQADVWKVLWLMRRTSTVIMTSNKSAEVDVLADRAVILARLGYRICLQLLPDASSALIRNRLQSLSPEYRVLSEIGLEMMIYLPKTDQARARKVALQLRGEKSALKLSHVGAPYRTIEDAVMRIWNRVHEPSYAASPSADFDVTALSQHQKRAPKLSRWWSARRRFSALSTKKVLLFRAHVRKFGLDAITCGAYFFLLHLSLVDRAPSLGAHAASGSLVKLDARSVGLGAFVRDWPSSPVFAGIVLRSLLEESGVKHLLPLQEEPGEFLRSLPVGEWRHQGLGIELHAANAAPGASSWVTLWWSGERWASSGAALTLLHAAQLANVSRVAGARIRAQAGPLPRARWAASAEQVLERAFNDVHAFGAVLVLSVLLASMTVSIGVLARSEAVSGLELLQAMTGLGGCWYWLTHFLWDFIAPYLIFYVPALAPAFVYFFFTRGGLFLVTSLALLLIYGLALIPAILGGGKGAVTISKLYVWVGRDAVTMDVGCTPQAALPQIATRKPVLRIASGYCIRPHACFTGVGPTVLELIWDAEGPTAAPTGRSITAASRVVPSAALCSGMVRLLRLQALGQLCELPPEQRTGLCPQLRQRLLFSPTALESLAVCCPDGIGKPVPGFADLLLGDTQFLMDVVALLLVSIDTLVLLVVGDSVLAPIWHFMTHRVCHLFWRPSAFKPKSVTPGEGSGLMSTFSPVPVRRPPQSPANAPQKARLLPVGSPGRKEKKDLVLEAKGLCRTFGSVVAVRGVSLHVRRGVCVGLLGQSGAGKSTTLRMLSGELRPTEGSRAVNAPDSESATLIGYQPSTAGCSPELTARQHLRLLAALRLLPDAENLVYHLLRLMDLEREADMPTGHYCRASLRKLGLAMALLGAPRLVLLDAPTSGVDPISARKMWQALNAFVVANNQAVVLATTLIPECLALCSDTLVLSQGEPTWAGSVPELRNTFFMGMVITVTLAREEEPAVMAQFQRNVREIFEGEAHMVTKHKNVVRFKIGDPLYPLASLKAKMNEVAQLNIVREVDFGPVALHKLFGIKEPE
ncbi:phospholipid-transporting ATPase ABCA3-like [Haemaphysalis longicornis]